MSQSKASGVPVLVLMAMISNSEQSGVWSRVKLAVRGCAWPMVMGR